MTSPVVPLTSSSACPASSAAAVVSAASSTSSSQYLHPEYMQMMPSSFDAKNSPLALLAQTCNSIGKDPTPPPQSSTSGSVHKSSTSSSAQSSGGVTSVSGSSSASSSDRKEYHAMNGRESLTSSSRAKSESPTTSGGVGRNGISSLSVGGKSSIVRDRIGRNEHRTSSSGNGGQMKTAGRASPSCSTSRSGRSVTTRDDLDVITVDGLHRRITAGKRTPDGGKPMAAAAVVSGPSIGGKMGVGLVPTSPVGSAGVNGDLEAQLSRYAAIQHQLSLAAAAAAVATSGRVPPSLYQPLYGAGNTSALGRTPTFHDIAAAAAAAAGLSPFTGTSSQSGSSMSAAAPGIASSSGSLYPPLGCLPGLPPFPPSFGSSSFPSLLDPVLQQACANAAAMASGVQSSPSSMYSDYSAKIKAAAAHSGSSSHSACKDPYCFRCQLAAIFQIPPSAAGSFCNGGVSPGSVASHHLGQQPPTPADKQSSGAGMLPSSLSPYLPLHAAMLLQQLQQQSSVGLSGYSADADIAASTPSPFVCSWVDGPTSEFCGKRFSSSEDLLRHLRTHASSIVDYTAASPSTMQFSSSLTPGSAMAAQAAAALQAAFAAAAAYPSGTSRHSPGSTALDMQQAGATSCSSALGVGNGVLLSSGGSLLLNGSRYHPYSKPSSSSHHSSSLYSPSALVSSLPPNSLSTSHHFANSAGALSTASSLPFQTLSSSSSAAALQAFYSPYAAAVYGQRLGAAAVGP